LTEYPSVEYGYGYSIADENVFATLWIPIIILWPVWWHEHSANERVSRASLEKLVAIYKSFLFSL
jgi:acetylornithine deacetylase/succinyl-diaminopimelate desuccinylase-like protein